MAIRARLTAPREFREEWPWHKAQAVSLNASLLFTGDRRMEAENFLAAGFATRHRIMSKRQGWKQFSEFADTRQPSRLKGINLPANSGLPFLAATQVFDFQPQPRKWLSEDHIDNLEDRLVSEGTILVTRSGTVGRSTLADASLRGIVISDDLLRVHAHDPELRGWIYAYLRAPSVRAMMASAQYGHIIKHLEVGHLSSLPLVEPPADAPGHFQTLSSNVISNRNEALRLIEAAFKRFESIVGLPPSLGDGTDGFVTRASEMFGSQRRLEGHFHNPLARAAELAIDGSGLTTDNLVDLVADVFIPGRFKHVYGPDGFPYLDSAQILEVAPDVEKFVLSLENEKKAGYLVEAGTLLLPCSGQLHGIIGSVVLADHWHENKVLTNHILRIVPKPTPEIRIGYLQAVLAHPVLGRPRVLRGAYGSSVPELSVDDIKSMRIPRLTSEEEAHIAGAMEKAARLLSDANELEEQLASEAEAIVHSFLRAS